MSHANVYEEEGAGWSVKRSRSQLDISVERQEGYYELGELTGEVAQAFLKSLAFTLK